MIRFSCPVCSQHIAAADAGAKTACPSCGQRLQVPMPRPEAIRESSAGAGPVAPDGRPAVPPHPPESDRSWCYAVLGVSGVVALKVLVSLLAVVALFLILLIRLSHFAR